MIPNSETIVGGLLRASIGLSIAALSVAACVRLCCAMPQAEQWAWMIVLTQGVILFPVAIPIATEFAGPGTVPQQDRTAAPSSELPGAWRTPKAGWQTTTPKTSQPVFALPSQSSRPGRQRRGSARRMR